MREEFGVMRSGKPGMLNIGIIGTGLIAKEHAQAISMLPDIASLVAAADVNSQRLDDFCSSFQVARHYQGATDLIADPEVNLVAITTPPSAHEELVVTALEQGKYVFCEKPIAHSLASASRIAEADARHPGRLTVSHQLRCDALFRRLVWLCRNNWIGDIQSALIERYSFIPHVNQGKNGWWGSWEIAGGGVLITQLIHELDLLLLVMGPPLSVSAAMDTRYTGIRSEDYVEATIRFAGEATARCVGSVNSGRLGGGFTIHGSSGTVGVPWNFTTKDPSRMSKAMKELNRALPETRPASSSLVSRGSRFLARRMGVKPKPALTPHAQLYKQITQSIQLGNPLPIPPAEVLGPLELCFAAYESALTGREVGLPLSSRSTVYSGVSKEQYDARKCARTRNEQRAIQTVNSQAEGNVVRVGLIGLDTTHASAFTSILHDPNNPFHIPGAKVVAAYPGGSPDMSISISRVDGFTNELKNTYGVPIADSPEDVADICDLVFILASDGRTHPGLLRSVVGYGKPVFLDKPFAISASDAQDMFTLVAETGTRVFASSAFRYADGLVSVLNSIQAGGELVKTCCVRYWLQIQETQGRYFWYGIHGAEMLFAIMGRGALEVEVSSGVDHDSITVRHDDGRQSSILGSTSDGTFNVSIETDQRELNIDLSSSMPSLSARLLWAALDVLTEGHFPQLWGATSVGSVSGTRPGRALDPALEETMEIVRLLDAAQRSYASHQRVDI
jgi:predicted dehydrogenase